MRSFALFLALAVPSVTAFAAPNVPTDSHTKLSSPAHKAEWIRVSFYNQNLRGREVTIGENTFAVPARSTVHLSIAPGSTVQVSSPWDQHIDGPTKFQVAASDANSTVTLR